MEYKENGWEIASSVFMLFTIWWLCLFGWMTESIDGWLIPAGIMFVIAMILYFIGISKNYEKRRNESIAASTGNISSERVEDIGLCSDVESDDGNTGAQGNQGTVQEIS